MKSLIAIIVSLIIGFVSGLIIKESSANGVYVNNLSGISTKLSYINSTLNRIEKILRKAYHVK